MEQTVKYLTTDLLRIAYLEYGSREGVPLILLHGFPYDVYAFEKACRLLAGDTETSWHIYVPWLRGYGETAFLSEETIRSGEQGALAYDLVQFMDAAGIEKAYLAGFDWGGRAACIVSALFPERVMGLVSCGVGYNMQDPANWQRPVSPAAEARAWYVYYFNTQRGENALHEKRKDLCRYLWETWSPNWQFTQEEYDKSAASFENPDFAPVVLHSYRCRIGEVPEDSRYGEISRACAQKPPIPVPSIIMLGMADGVTPPPQTDTDKDHFTGFYKRILLPSIGHNVPGEAPEVFADAVRTLRKQSVTCKRCDS